MPIAFPRLTMCAALATALAGCAQHPAPVAETAPQTVARTEIIAPKAPPAPRVERLPPAPKPMAAMQWRPGRWMWTGAAFAWETGEWIDRPNARALWEPGRWEPRGAGWAWVSGRWL